jgi:hypothetical protein
MMMPRRHLARLLLVAALPLAACSHTPPPERVQAVASAAPPEPRHEERGHAPHPGWVWVAGYWNRVNDRFIWVQGTWGVPPSGFSSWEPAHWIHDQRGWVLVRGRWK